MHVLCESAPLSPTPFSQNTHHPALSLSLCHDLSVIPKVCIVGEVVLDKTVHLGAKGCKRC